MHGRADRIVVNAEVVADPAHQHLAGVQPDARADLYAVGAACLRGLGVHRLLNCQRRVAGTHRMILVRNRCAEQRHDAVANDFVDRALVAMHGIHHHADCPIEDAACFFRIVAFEDLERAFDVGKQHRDVLALARHQRSGIKDASRQVIRRVGLG